MYFQKLKRPTHVQRVPHADIYSLTLLYDDRDRAQAWRATSTALAQCYVAWGTDGHITLLKEPVSQRTEIVRRTSKRGRRETLSLRSTHWALPSWITEVLSTTSNPEIAQDPEGWVRGMFVLALLTYQSAIRRIVVRAKHGPSVATFGIDLARAKYFFKDRDVVELAADGRKKRIFHAVRQHTRVISPTLTTDVRDHYRGLRHFDWNGHQIQIVLPSNAPILDFPESARYLADVPKAQRPRYIDQAEAGTKLADVLSS
jgi:hypothetical protein